MNKLSAKHFLSDKGYGSGTNYTTGAVSVLMEQYATARLEAYKEEVYKKNIYVSSPLEQGISINERIYRQGLSDGVKSVLSSLNTCDPRNTECELYDKLRPFTTTAPLPPNFSKP